MSTESDYPKLLFRAGTGEGHMLGGAGLKIDGKWLCDVLRIETEEAEIAALEDGWHDSPEVACSPLVKELAPEAEKAPKTEKAA